MGSARVAVVAAAVLASSGCASRLGANALLHPMRLPQVGDSPLPHRELKVLTHDGLALDALVFEPPSASTLTAVLLHGKDANHDHLLGAVPRLLRRGYQVVVYDQRAHGRSQGTVTTYGVNEVRDLVAVLDAVGAQRVVLIGESMGAAVALQAAAVEPRVAAVVAGASFSDLPTIVAENTPWWMSRAQVREAVSLAEAEGGFAVEQVSPMRSAEAIRVPVLLLHGLQDRYVDLSHSRRILKHLGEHGHLVLLDGVGHIDILLHDEAWVRIEQFLDQAHLAD